MHGHVRCIRRFALFAAVFTLTSFMLMILGYRLLSNEHTAYASEKITVIIDAGHGGEDCGAIGIDGTLEKHINLNIALFLNELLRCAGINSRLTRTEDTMLYDKNSDYQGRKKALDFARRLEIAREYENALFISIHLNSFSQSKYSGLQVYYSENSPGSAILAENIQSLSKKLLMPNNDRKIKSAENDIYLLRMLSYPAVLVECGFLSNPEECEKLREEVYQRKLAFVIYSALTNYLSDAEKL